MLNVVGAKDDGAAHLAADPVLARFPQDQVLAHRKDRPSEVARHDVSRHPVRHRCSRRAIARPNAGFVRFTGETAKQSLKSTASWTLRSRQKLLASAGSPW